MASKERAHVASLRDFANQFLPALNRLPSNPSVLKAQRALTVFSRALEELEEEFRK